MTIDPSTISVVKPRKITKEELVFGSTMEKFEKQKADAAKPAPAEPEAPRLDPRYQDVGLNNPKCNLCCMTFGAIIAATSCLMVSGIGVGMFILFEKRINYTYNGVFRHIGWLTIPGAVAGTTLHYWLPEAMWSGKKSTWGWCWAKAFAANTVSWCLLIGASTLFWRKGLRVVGGDWGKKLYHRYPIPTDPLESRLIREGMPFFGSMGWTYWLSGLASGQFGFASAVAFCLWNDRPHYLMNPAGYYAGRCLPKWRREQIAKRVIL